MTAPFGQAARPFGPATAPFGQGTPPFGQGTRPFGQGTPPFGRARPAVGRPHRPAYAEVGLADDEEIVAGRHPVEEAFVAGRPARRLLVVPQRRDALERLVLHATALRLPVVEVEGGTLTSLAGFDGHQGVALVVEARRSADPAEILARAIARGEPAFVVALDSLEDPQNLGTLLRSSEAAGVHGVVFPTRRQAPLSPAAVKASSGASEHLLLAPVEDLPGALADLHLRGLRVIGADADAPLTYRDADLRGPVVLVIGSEGRGLAPAVRRRCDLLVRIPMRGHVASLNAAVAGSILVFEAASQRGLPEGAPPPADRLRAATTANRSRATAPDGQPSDVPGSPSGTAPDGSASDARGVAERGTGVAERRDRTPATARRAGQPAAAETLRPRPRRSPRPPADAAETPAARRRPRRAETHAALRDHCGRDPAALRDHCGRDPAALRDHGGRAIGVRRRGRTRGNRRRPARGAFRGGRPPARAGGARARVGRRDARGRRRSRPAEPRSLDREPARPV